MNCASKNRAGITLMEVLIATGILAVGLSSVVALLPAARSQAERALVLDRGAQFAANALADAATFGLLRPDSHTTNLAMNFAVTIDPAFITTGIKSGSNGGLSGIGVFSSPHLATKAPAAYHRLFTESRDDIVVSLPPGAGPDDLPINTLDSAGVRSYEGRFTCMYFLQVGPPPASLGRVSVVVFHRRDISPSAPKIVRGTIAGGMVTVAASELGGRRLVEIARPGVVVYVNDLGVDKFFQASAATVDATGASVFLTLSSPNGLTFKKADGKDQDELFFLPDSVGLAERTFIPEGTGAFTQ